MGKKKTQIFEMAEITGAGAEGKAIARVNDMVIFVSFAAPGDIVDLQVTRKRKRFAEAKILRFHHYSDTRTAPSCQHFGICGGCSWQHLSYSEQLKNKEKQVKDALVRIGKIDLPEIDPIVGSDQEFFYRNKLEFTFSNRRWYTREEVESGTEFSNWNALGFHVPGMFDKVVDIKKCWLQPDPSNEIRNFLRKYAEDNNLEFYDTREGGGFLRNLIIRTSSTGEVMVILSFFREDSTVRESLLNSLAEAFPGITSLLFTINSKANDTLYDQAIKVFRGEDHITEVMENLRFRIGPKSFFQTNTAQSLKLYQLVREFAGLTGREIVYDLYTGTGTIANFLASQSKKVVGIESVPEAIEDAKINARLNRIINTHFIAGDIKDLLTQAFIAENGRPDVVITDPPRAGMHESVIETLLQTLPSDIIYVSCNPATQARDLGLLSTRYKVVKVQPVDMFPHTHHVENVVKLSLMG